MARNRRTLPACLALLGAFALSSASHCADAAEELKLRRWAIIATEDKVAASVGDLLTARLSQQKGIELVERERLAEILKEIKLSALSDVASTADRLSLGRLLKADGLVVVSIEERPDRSVLKIVFCETSYGLRLRVEYHSVKTGADKIAKQCALALEATRKHFAEGVKKIIGVPTFVSKNLSHDYDHLQAGYARLLQNALMDHPGVAVIEMNEARLVSRELGLGGERLRGRATPLFVEGEFRMTKIEGDDQPSVHLIVKIVDGRGTVRRLEKERVDISDVPSLLLEQIPRDLLRLASDSRIRTLNREQEFSRLVQRADQLSELGVWEHASGLREAALLLKPDSFDQRVSVVADYLRDQAHRRRVAREEMIRKFPNLSWRELWVKDNSKIRTAEVKIMISALRNVRYHSVQLIDRRQLNPREIALLIAGIERVAAKIFFYKRPQSAIPLDVRLGFDEIVSTTINRFPELDVELAGGALRPAVRKLTTQARAVAIDAEKWTAEKQYGALSSELLRAIVLDARLKMKRRNATRELADKEVREQVYLFLTKTARDDMPPVPYMATLLLHAGGSDIDDFYDRMVRTKRPRMDFYARYGRWSRIRRVRKSVDAEERQMAMRLLKDLGYSKPLGAERTGDTPYALHLSSRLSPTGRVRPPGDFPFVTPGSNHRLAHSFRFEEVSSESIPRGTNSGSLHVRCGNVADVYWSGNEIKILKRNSDPISVKSTNGTLFDVVWDGQHIWVAATEGGIQVISLDGAVQASISSSEGLPDYSSDAKGTTNFVSLLQRNPKLRLHSVSKGRCFAVGVMGKHGRVWIADITAKADARGYRVNVIHEAKMPASEVLSTEDLNPHEIFSPTWITEYTCKAGRKYILIGRRERLGEQFKGRYPLAIDLNNLDVLVMPVRLPTMNATLTSASFACVKGRLFQASRWRVFLHEPRGDPRATPWNMRVLLRGRPAWNPSLLSHNDLLYRMGADIHCIDPETLASRILKGPRTTRSFFGVTANHGMVSAWRSRNVSNNITTWREGRMRIVTDLDDKRERGEGTIQRSKPRPRALGGQE